jgi:hypothetical protein
MPNAFAYAVLAVWPVVALVAFASPGARAHLARTTAWMMLLPAMFLPAVAELSIPGLPALDKHRIAFLSIAAGLHLFHRPRMQRTGGGLWFPRALMAALAACLFETIARNGDPLVYGPTKLPGLTTHDGISAFAALVLDRYVAFSVGLRVFRTEDDLRALFRVLTRCALIYLPLAAFEVRMSPQLHYWIYGYYQHSFGQMARGGSFRPLLFMAHGLTVAFFGALCFTAALGLHRVRDREWPRPAVRLGAIALLLVLCKSMASILYSAFSLGMAPLLRRRVGKWALLAVAAVVITFPVTRFTDVFPTDEIVALAARVSEERAASLQFRFDNEDLLLHRAMERPAFGWGTWGRNRVYSAWGDDVAVTDGQWIIVLGVFGVVGLAGFLLFPLVPVMRFLWNQRRMPPDARVLAGQLALMVTICTVDILPNAWGDLLPLAFSGALFTLSGELARRRQGVESPRGGAPAAAPATTAARPARGGRSSGRTGAAVRP